MTGEFVVGRATTTLPAAAHCADYSAVAVLVPLRKWARSKRKGRTLDGELPAAAGAPASAADVVADARARATRDVRDAVTPLWRTPYSSQLVV